MLNFTVTLSFLYDSYMKISRLPANETKDMFTAPTCFFFFFFFALHWKIWQLKQFTVGPSPLVQTSFDNAYFNRINCAHFSYYHQTRCQKTFFTLLSPTNNLKPLSPLYHIPGSKQFAKLFIII
jgi:hypothetical protein